MKWIDIIVNYFFPKKKNEIVESNYNDDGELIEISSLTVLEQKLYEIELEKFHKFLDEDYERGRLEYIEKNRLHNDICPKCQSTNVNDRIREKDVKVTASARSYGYYGSSAETSYVQTAHAVSKCNYCKHEWFKKYETYNSPYSHYIHVIENVCRRVRENPNFDYTKHEYYNKAVTTLIPFISIESFIPFRNKFDQYYVNWGEERDITPERLKAIGFKSLGENHYEALPSQ